MAKKNLVKKMLAEKYFGSNFFGLKKVLVKEIVERKKLGQHFLTFFFCQNFLGAVNKLGYFFLAS